MNLLDQLEQVIDQEHAAMLKWDWRALETCIQQKQELAEQLSQEGLQQASHGQALRIRHATRHNVQLAADLSQQLGGLLSRQQRTTTYDRGGRVEHQPSVMLSFQG